MAKKELLCILVGLVLNSQTVYALDKDWRDEVSEDDKKWALELKEQTQNRFWQNIKNQADEYFGQEEAETMLKPRPALQIFVSKSMSNSLLTRYAREASIYGGVLVFRGLPNGSMIKLTELVTEISDEEYPAAMQIDDESFKQYGIDVVPAIVLKQQESVLDIAANKTRHDKISGNLGVKHALEQFAREGDLAAEAEDILDGVGRE